MEISDPMETRPLEVLEGHYSSSEVPTVGSLEIQILETAVKRFFKMFHRNWKVASVFGVLTEMFIVLLYMYGNTFYKLVFFTN